MRINGEDLMILAIGICAYPGLFYVYHCIRLFRFGFSNYPPGTRQKHELFTGHSAEAATDPILFDLEEECFKWRRIVAWTWATIVPALAFILFVLNLLGMLNETADAPKLGWGETNMHRHR